MNSSVLAFVTRNLSVGDVRGRRVVEVGSRDVNGSPRAAICASNPISYLGVDIEPGPGVDVVCDAARLVGNFGPSSFDVVISTEMLEHVADWRLCLAQMKGVLSPGGVLVLTTRSPGFKYHPYPEDHWRFTCHDIRMALADMRLDAVEADPEAPGVFARAVRPDRFEPLDLSHLTVVRAPGPGPRPMSAPAVTLITPTRDRPEAFRLCARWMSRQTFDGAAQWLIVDDGDVPEDLNAEAVVHDMNIVRSRWDVEHVRRAPSTKQGTLGENLIEALGRVRAPKVVVIEDDDHYSPVYLEEMLWRLRTAKAAGETRARYYNVRDRRWHVMDNTKHASLCRTGFSAEFVQRMRESAQIAIREGDPFVDLRFWGMRPNYPIPAELMNGLFHGRGISVGMKGLPGRGGLGSTHKPGAMPNRDPKWEKLAEWIGPDALMYMGLAERLGWKPA